MGLTEEIELSRKDIRTDNYSMSIGEWINLYQNKEIDIHPEFQRFFRWESAQKARFIESLLLGIPIPPIFVSQRKDGIWDVIDGLQRLSTIYQFVGILKDEDGKLVDPLVLEKTTYLQSLEGKKWEDNSDSENSFNQDQRLSIKRTKVHVNIIQKESDEFAKYELFQRLNTGGSPLSDQEMRNCILVWLNKKMFSWVASLAEYNPFRECMLLSDRAVDEQFNLELVLRFIILRKMGEEELKNIRDLGEFLTDKMREMAELKNFDYDEEEKAFKQTFNILSEVRKEDSFRKYDSAKKRYVRGFSVSAFEIFALGIGYNYLKVNNLKEVEKRIEKFWIDEQATPRSSSGISASSRIPKTISLGRELFDL